MAAGDTTIGKHLKTARPQIPGRSETDRRGTHDDHQQGKSGKMPAFESKLTKDQISEVVKFIRSLKM